MDIIAGMSNADGVLGFVLQADNETDNLLRAIRYLQRSGASYLSGVSQPDAIINHSRGAKVARRITDRAS